MLNVIVIGLGPIGLAAAHAVQKDPGMELSGLVDLDPQKQGKTLHELFQAAEKGGVKCVGSLKDVQKVDVAIVGTTSYFADMKPLLDELIARKAHVVSSCEEMLWPWYRNDLLAKEVDLAAQRAGVALLGTGVNPGFVLDYLPLVLSSMVTEVKGVKAVRRVDATKRRRPLQQKVGATMTVDHFNALKREGKIGHKGMAESVVMLAAGLGAKVGNGEVIETLEPVVAKTPIESMLGTIQPGQVAGMNNVGKWQGQGLSIELDLTMSCGLDNTGDTVYLTGPVPLQLTIPGSTPGDSATVAALVNCARILPLAKPGLRTMLDVGRLASARVAS
jgi:4-hydroxy-tetrahydrodipicolinate reductase